MGRRTSALLLVPAIAKPPMDREKMIRPTGGETCKGVGPVQGKDWEAISRDCESQKRLPSAILRVAVSLLFIAASLRVFFQLPASLIPRDHDQFMIVRATERFKSRSDNESILSLPKDQTPNSCNPACPEDQILSWLQNSSLISLLKEEKDHDLKVAMLNVPIVDTQSWELFTGGGPPTVLTLELVSKAIKWSDLYPERIDEEEQWHTPKCPDLPMPKFSKGSRFDIVIARVPCGRRGKLVKGCWQAPNSIGCCKGG